MNRRRYMPNRTEAERWMRSERGDVGFIAGVGPQGEGRGYTEAGWTGRTWDRTFRGGHNDMAQGRGILRYYGNMGPEVGGDYTDEPLRERVGGVARPRRQTAAMQRADTHRGKGPKGYQRNDERIREDVCDHLTDAHDVDASDVTVHVTDGEVTLEGVVHDRFTKRMAELLAERVRGVKDVHNRLRIRRGDDVKRDAAPTPAPTPAPATIETAEKAEKTTDRKKAANATGGRNGSSPR